MTAFNDPFRLCQRPQSLRWWLSENSVVLSRLARSARASARLQRQLQALLPQELSGHWRVAKLDARILCLVTENPLWATQLRYRRTVLLQGAESILGWRPQQLQIRIEPPIIARPAPPPARLSATAAESLRQSAECMDPGPLREALLRLASRRGDK